MASVLGVVGFGTMGSEIALLGSLAGYTVIAFDAYPAMIEQNLTRLAKVAKLLGRDQKFFAAGSLADDTQREQVLGRIQPVNELGALAPCQIVIEAAPEDIHLKHKIFSELCQVCPAETLFATNTSSISITEIAAVVEHPARLVGMHFFNPPTQMKLVEIIPGLSTAEDTIEQVTTLAGQMGRKAIRVKETPGFVVNRVLIAMLIEAITLYEEGVASVEDIDEALKLGAGMPLGPFKLADLVGLDVIEHAACVIQRELGRDKFHPPFTLRQHVRAGRLGRKTKQGFYRY